MVGQTCRFAAAPGRAPLTISEMTFGSHSNSLQLCSLAPLADQFGNAVEAADEAVGLLAREVRREDQLPFGQALADDRRGNPSQLSEFRGDGHATALVSGRELLEQDGAVTVELEGDGEAAECVDHARLVDLQLGE